MAKQDDKPASEDIIDGAAKPAKPAKPAASTDKASANGAGAGGMKSVRLLVGLSLVLSLIACGVALAPQIRQILQVQGLLSQQSALPAWQVERQADKAELDAQLATLDARLKALDTQLAALDAQLDRAVANMQNAPVLDGLDKVKTRQRTQAKTLSSLQKDMRALAKTVTATQDQIVMLQTEAQEDTPKETPKEVPKETSEATPEEISKETPEETPKLDAAPAWFDELARASQLGQDLGFWKVHIADLALPANDQRGGAARILVALSRAETASHQSLIQAASALVEARREVVTDTDTDGWLAWARGLVRLQKLDPLPDQQHQQFQQALQSADLSLVIAAIDEMHELDGLDTVAVQEWRARVANRLKLDELIAQQITVRKTP